MKLIIARIYPWDASSSAHAPMPLAISAAYYKEPHRILPPITSRMETFSNIFPPISCHLLLERLFTLYNLTARAGASSVYWANLLCSLQGCKNFLGGHGGNTRTVARKIHCVTLV